MAVVINELEVIANVVSQPATGNGGAQSGQAGPEKPLEFDEVRRRLERAFRLASRLAAD